MTRGGERIDWVTGVLREVGLDGLVCTLPANVLMLSGYWPVVGTAIAIATASGKIMVLVPEDERALAGHGWAAEVQAYSPGALNAVTTPIQQAREPLASLLRHAGLERGRIGYEAGAAFEPVTYAAMHLFGTALEGLLRGAVPNAALIPAEVPLTRLRSRLTTAELDRVQVACAIAETAFAEVASAIGPGFRESEVAALLSSRLGVLGLGHEGVDRAGGFAYCMSGPNAALAGGAYARTRARELGPGDLVLMHCNSFVDGYWTDITRTYCLGAPDERQRAMYAAVFAARAAALAAIRPGVEAKTVDHAAREVLDRAGFGPYFTHGVGHNVGFSAISTQYPPRLHPAADGGLEPGMTFNIEPAIYIRGYGGIRHCDVVTVGAEGAEVLTPFQGKMDELIVAC